MEVAATQEWLMSAVQALVAAGRRTPSPVGVVDRPLEFVADGVGSCAPAPLADDDRREALGLVRRHRLTVPFATHAVSLGLSERMAATLSAARRRQIGEGLIATAHTATLSSALQAAGVEHLVVKGAALSAILHDEPAARGVGDIDLWVRHESVGAAEAVIARLGWHRRAELGRSADPGDHWRWRLYRFARHEREWDGDRRPTVDIHWRIAHRQATLGYDFNDAFARSVPVPSIGPTVRTLCGTDALVHMAEHARKEVFPTLRSLVDIVQLVDLCGPSAVAELAKGRHPSARNVQLALAVAAHIAPDLAENYPPTRWQRRLATQAIDGCLSLEFGGNVRAGRDGRERRSISLRHRTWVIMSAPSAVSAVSYGLRLATAVVAFGTTAWRRR